MMETIIPANPGFRCVRVVQACECSHDVLPVVAWAINENGAVFPVTPCGVLKEVGAVKVATELPDKTVVTPRGERYKTGKEYLAKMYAEHAALGDSSL